MSKRTDTIKSLFTAPPAGSLSADNKNPGAPMPARVSAGAVRSLKDSFSEVEKENQELRDQIAAGASIMEIDPLLVDPSPVVDRLRDDDSSTDEVLKQSIAQRGQEVPILVRHHPTMAGRYQSAYGHRRVRIARQLGILIKAILKPLSDEQLVIAQGLENGPREDLSFVERAMFALRIEEAGHKRSVVQDALAIDRAEASKLIAVAKAIPRDIVEAIGKAPKVGRGRWQSFSELLSDVEAVKRIRTAIGDPVFASQDSDTRFLAAFSAARPVVRQVRKNDHTARVLAGNGEQIGEVQRADRELRLILDKKVPAAFADFLVGQLPRLFDSFSGSEERRDAPET
ncbi:plasmid partitioning protein RepB [Tardiphaga sp. 1201_B9_N1_1]|uniref:plasmid partitioning protein RepB n=1 Tax=unclassified Tardiphaga TaxID=2631404 RepID=UPI003F239E2B